ncbi:binding partner of ACD11 1-like isoform X1 [Coffea eugenioides]|uniref:Binding partner of ACD11 1-like isoform X1 n=1 Tax=Coffea arabica TaxID=13443 RepID=A0A6P6V7T5_COFAR|nr:binding partner of ACD11 1-like isoform X1 [Coffea arabica]XP_027098756.1 binding partner of ACD11 1-like isoform X1 [Coffea arabica]XP_027154118.1 binding partner of ACD11 1-like isoform X1 [Coffea eugenioides]
MDHTNQNLGENTQITSNPNWTINVPDQIRTIKVSNISLSATDKEIQEFFSFSGNIQYVEMQRETETTQLAYVTFEESKGADTAMLLTGATIADLPISITQVENYQLPPNAVLNTEPTSTGSAVQKAEDVVSTMLSKGFSLGKDALNKAKSFDEKHQLTSTASATVASIDTKLGLTEKLSQGTAAVNVKVKEMDERFQVSEKTRSAFAAAEQRATVAGSAIMSNRYVSSGASWVSNAFNRVAKAAEGVSLMTKEKVAKAEEERRDNLQKEQVAMVNEFAHVHLDQSLVGDVPAHPANSPDGSKLV